MGGGGNHRGQPLGFQSPREGDRQPDPVRVLHRRTNEAASAGTPATEASSQTESDWLLMLDDDSSPTDARS